MSDQQVLVAEVTRSAHVRSASAAPADQDQT